MKKIYLLCISISSLQAMVDRPLDTSLGELNAALNQIAIILTSQPVVIGEKTIHVLPQQFKNLKDKKSENFSSYIAGLPEVPEGEEATIFLPPVIDPTIFNYLADWQTTKSEINTVGDDDLVAMIVGANVLGMERVLDFLSSFFAGRQRTVLFANPQVWWDTKGKKLSDLPNELQAKISKNLLISKELYRFIIDQAKIYIPQLPGMARSLWFRPTSEFNLSIGFIKPPKNNPLLGMLYFDEKKKLAIKTINDFYLYQRANEFIFPFAPRADHEPAPMEKGIGWSPDGRYLFTLYDNPQTKDASQLERARLLKWNERKKEWELSSFSKKVGSPLCWSPDSRFLVTENIAYESQIEVYFEKENNTWIESTYPFNGDLNGVAFSHDSHYLALYTSKELKILERQLDNTFNIIFEYAYDINNSIRLLKWHPINNGVFVIQTRAAKIELWQKTKDANSWTLKQDVADIKTQTIFKSSFVTWSPSGIYLTLANREVNAEGKVQPEKIQLFTYQNDQLIKSDELNVIEETDPQESKEQRVQDERIVEINDIIWSKDEKSILSIISSYSIAGSYNITPSKILSYAKLWVKMGDTWEGVIIQTSELNPWISWDMMNHHFAAIEQKIKVESSQIHIWDLTVLQSFLYLRLGQVYLKLSQAALLTDWFNKASKGQKFTVPQALRQDFEELPDVLKKLIR